MPEAKLGADRNGETDESVMARYADGDGDAFDEIFRRYEARAHAFFAKRTGSTECAEDLYQELFLCIHRARDSYDSSRPFAPWFFQIAYRLWVDDIRREFHRREVPLDARDVLSGSPSVERVLEDRDDLEEALSGLSPDERYALDSFRVGGAKYFVIARSFGKSVDAVRKMAPRALQRIGTVPPTRYARP